MSAAPDLGVGVVGIGDVAGIYLDTIPALAGLHLVACAGRDPAALQARLAPRGLPAVTLDALLRDEAVDVVLNLTPPAVHAEIGLAALSAGKHLYTEKPLAATTAEARRLLDEAAIRGLRIGCAPDTFLGAGGRLARALLDEGRIGRVLSGSATFMSRGVEHRHPDPGFFFRAGGGPVLDIGPYYLTALVNLLGPVAAVQARASTGFAERLVTAPGPRHGTRIAVETPTTVQALLSFRSGCDVTMTMSWDVRAHGHPPIELYGEEGTLRPADPDTFGGAVAIGRGDDWQALGTETLPFGRPNWRPASAAETRPLSANYRGLGLAELASAVRLGTVHRSSSALGYHVLETCEAIRDAALARCSVAVSSAPERPDQLAAADAEALLRSSGPTPS